MLAQVPSHASDVRHVFGLDAFAASLSPSAQTRGEPVNDARRSRRLSWIAVPTGRMDGGRRRTAMTLGRSLRGLLLVALMLVPRHARADDVDRQCWDCLRRLAMEFPEKNPQEDPFYEDGLSPGSVVGAFAKCSLDDSEIPTLQRIIGVLSDAMFEKNPLAYVREHLKEIPSLSDSDRAKLVDGARQDLSTTLGAITNRNCRIMFQSQFDSGASRAWLLQVVRAGRARQMAP